MEKLLEKARRGSRRWPLGLLAVALVLSGTAVADSTTATKSPSAPPYKANPMTKLKLAVLEMPLSFELNRGQTDAKVKFLTQAQNFTVFLTPGETILRGRNADVLRMRLQNANQSPKLVGEQRQAKVTNYYIGNDRSKWLEGVPNYGQVRFQNVYSGIDMVYHSDQRTLEYDFVVNPGAEANQIGVVFDGASSVRINEQGELELKSEGGTSVNHKPVVYQTINGKRKAIDGSFTLSANNVVGFKLGQYDHTQPLVIDPTLQVLSFFGGNLNDEASGIATSAVQPSLSAAGVVFVGRSESATLPGVGGTKPSPGINWDAFATGLGSGTPGVPASGGTAILWTTYFGGLADDAARGVAMDNQGNAYVVGYTNSSNFPAGTAVQYDAFVVKIAAAGGAITGSTLYGGPGVDQGTSIALDYSTFSTLANAVAITNPATDPQVTPNVVIGGFTTGAIGAAGSPAASAGKTPNNGFSNCTATGAAAAGCGTNDGFVAYFNNALAVQNATYIGGGGNDQVNGVAVDIWGNVYATGFATPATAPNFPVSRGIAQTSLRANWDAAQGPLGSAVAFVAKWACTTGSPAVGVPSPPPAMPACGGTNKLNSLTNSALFGGTASGGYNVGGTITPAGSFINPQQMAIITPAGGVPPNAGSGINGITEAGMAIAVDQNGWGQQGVAGIAPSGFINAAGFPDIVPNTESNASCNLSAAGNNGIGAPRCAVSSSNSATTGGFEPGLSGPHVYVAGMTASRDFVNSLVFNASCTGAPFVSSTAVPALCPVPEVWGGAVTAAGATPTDRCDPLTGAGPGGASGVCPTGLPAGVLQDIRIKSIGGTIGATTFNFNAGQTQGWLASFQFPALTQEVVQAMTASPSLVTSLNPPTIPNYVILQPATCPPQLAGCIEGGTNPAIPALPFVAANFPAPNFGCVAFGVPTPTGVTCPTPFFGSWNAVAVDSDQQVYVIGQIGMSGTTGAGGGFGVFGTGAPNRLALELERIQPYANTPGGNVSAVFPNFCPGPANAPCAFPELQFPFSGTVPGGSTTSLLVDNFPGAGGGAGGPGSILNSNFGQILPGAPPFPNPNQPGGLGNGIAVSATREAFFVGTTTVLTVPGAAPPTATATADLDAAGHVLDIVVATAGAGYTTLPTCTITGGGGTGATCSLAAGGFTLSGAGSITGGPGIGNPCPACITAGGTGYTAVPVVTLSAPPAAATSALTYINATPLVAPALPVPPTQGNLTGGAGTSSNAGESCAGPPCAGNGPEDVIYGAVQFYDAIAQPTAINFTATVNNFNSLTGPNGQTGLNAKAFVNYSNWEGQPLNVPPGCIVTPVVPSVATSGGTFPIFNVVSTGTSSFQVTVNATAATLNALAVPGVFTQMVVFSKSDACSGVGFPPGLDSWDPLTLTLTVSAPLNVSPENTFVITSKLATGIVDQYFAAGTQLVANQVVNTGIDVTTAASNGPINFTAQIIPGQNWSGFVTGAIQIPTPTDIIYTASGPNGGQTRVPVVVNTQVLAGLPQGTYTALIMFAASPETPALPTSGSTACGWAVSATGQLTQIANFPTTPVGSGTTSPTCIPIEIQITANVVANIPVGLVFGTSTTPQQTSVVVANPTTVPYTFTGGYVATPVFGTALPAANVSFAGTATTCPSSIGSTVGGTIAPGGLCTIPIQVTPVGLKTGVYSGQILLSNNGQASGATPQTTVPIVVYVGPNSGTTGEDSPSGNGLGLMLPVNVPPTGLGTLASVGSAPGSPGSYPLFVSVPSGTGPNGINQIPNPTLLQVTGLNNTVTTAFSVNAPTSTVPGVSFTNVGAGFGGALSGGCTTYGSLSSLPGSPLGPPCVWSMWVDATALNSTNTVANAAACGSNPITQQPNLSVSGTVSFSGGGFPQATLVVPLTVCVTDSPALTLGMPNTFPNPTFGPTVGTGFGNCNSALATGGPSSLCQLAQPSNLVPGFPQSIVDMVLATSNGSSLGSTVTPPINLLSSAGNSSQVCKVLDIRTNGGIVANVTIAPTTVQWVTVTQAPAVFLGPPVNAPNSLQANSGTPFTGGNGVFGLGGLAGSIGIPGTPPFTAGPFLATPAMQTFQVCVNTDPVGNVAGTFSTSIMINGAGVGAITVPINMIISNGSTPPSGGGKDNIGVFRPSTGQFILDTNGNGTFDAGDTIANFGANGDLPVVGSWGSGAKFSQIGVFRSTGFVLNLESSNQLTGGYNFSQAAADGKVRTPAFGVAGDIPVAGDWNGTGIITIGVFRPSTGQWILDLNNNGVWDGTFGGDAAYNFGATGDIPVVGDWNGNGTSKFGVFRPSTGQFILDVQGHKNFDSTAQTFNFGTSGDIPVSINTTKRIGVFRPSTGQWILDTTSSTGTGSWNPTDLVFQFGAASDQPVVGFWTLP